jgi:hypothetical protein
MTINVCSAEYDLNEYSYEELLELHNQFVGNAAALVERAESWTVGVWQQRRAGYEKALGEYNTAITTVNSRIEKLKQEAVNAAPTSTSQTELLAPCWWFGCSEMVEPDNCYCEKHRLLSTDISLAAA